MPPREADHALAVLDIPDKVKDLKRSDFDKIIARAFAEAHGTYGVPRYLDRHSATLLPTQLLPESQLTSKH